MHVSTRVDYWVIDADGELADAAVVAALPGADATASPHSLAVETPSCEHPGELREALVDRLAAAVAAAHERDCRLLALGVRPDLLADIGSKPPAAPTADTRIIFEPEPEAVVDCYNVLLALDPAFVLLNTTSRGDGGRHYACGRPSLSVHARRVDPYRTSENDLTVADRADERAADRSEGGVADEERGFQPVRLVDGERRIEWRSPDPTTPTLLVDFIADVWTILRESTRYEIGVESFGNGFHRDRLALPDREWRKRYTEAAIHRGLSSVLLAAYLERLGFETTWYRSATPAAVDHCSAAALGTACQRRADLLEAEIGRSVTEA